MREFIYKLLRLEYVPEHCENCERLMLLLEDEKRRHDKLIANLLTPKVETVVDSAIDYQPRPSRYTPWSVTQQKLEAADRIKADELRKSTAIADAKKKIEELEKETGVKEENA